MKRKSFYITFAVVCVAVLSVIAVVGYNTSPPTVEPTSGPMGSQTPAAADYELEIRGDYVAVTPVDLYDISQFVVVGTYEKSNETFASEFGRPITEGTIKVEQVLKGEYTQETMNIQFYGGTVSVEEYLKTQNEDEIAKSGFSDLTEDEKQSKTVGYYETDEMVKADSGQLYMFFLSYTPDTDTYFVLSDAYGMRPMNETKQAYNPESRQYEDVDLAVAE